MRATTTTALLGVTGLLGAIMAAMLWRQLGPVLGWEIEITSALLVLLAAFIWLPIGLETAGFQLRTPLIRTDQRVRAAAVATPFHAGYSAADKERLNKLYAQLSRVFLENGADGAHNGLWGRLAALMEAWDAGRRHEMDSEKLLDLWRAAYDASLDFHTALYAEDGILRKEEHRNYKNELADILRDSATPTAQVTDHTYLHQLQSGLNGIGVLLQALARAKPLQDPHLAELIIAAAARTDVSFANTAYMFQDWLSQANRRALAAQAALQH